MKAKIHPPYYPKATVTCNCKMSFTVGSTKEAIRVEVCSNCHPFYTGRSLLIDAAGRVDKFEARRKKAAELGKTAKKARPSPEATAGKLEFEKEALKELRKSLLKQ